MMYTRKIVSNHKVRGISLEKFGMYILSLALILDCRSIWSYRISISEYVKILNLVLCIVGALIIISASRTRLTKRVLQIGGLLALYLFAYSIIRPVNLSSFYRTGIVTILLWFVVNTLSQKDRLLYCYENIIIIIALISLFFWLFGSVLEIIHPSGVIHSGWTMLGRYKEVPSYYGLYFSAQDNITYFGLHRNTAVFVEAPMSSFHFSLALMVETLLKKRKSRFKTAVLIVSTLTTLSTTGFLCLLGIYLYKLYTSKSHSKVIRTLKRLSIPFSTVIVFFIGWSAFSSKINSGSGIYRIDDFRVGFNAWKANPLFGGGFSNTDYLMSFTASWRSNTVGFSNSLTEILAFGGIMIFALYVLAFFVGIRNSRINNDKDRLFFILLFLLTLLITVVSYNYLTIFVLLWMAKKDQDKIGGFVKI